MNKFKKFGGEKILDIKEYLKDLIDLDPSITISIGCDSVKRKKYNIYAITIMTYSQSLKKGAHFVFYREYMERLRSDYERLNLEAIMAKDVAEYIISEISPIYNRLDLTDDEIRRYKYHLLKCGVFVNHITLNNEESYINSLTITSEDRKDYNLVDIHLDYNPEEGDFGKNKSNLSYKTYVPWLRGLGYRVFCKPMGYASTSAADLLLRKKRKK